jgi:hypothetical protein
MVDLFTAVRRMRAMLGRVSAYLQDAIGMHVPLDPVLERLARDVIGELKQVPIVEPSRDLAEAVLQRLKGTQDDHLRGDSGDHRQVRHE